MISQPKFVAGLSSQPCASATSWGVESQVNGVSSVLLPRNREALAVAAWLPPGVVHKVPGNMAAFHVASPTPAAAPFPLPEIPAAPLLAVPSPQLRVRRNNPIVAESGPIPATCPRVNVSWTFVIVAPAGMLLRSKAMRARRGELPPLVPAKRPGPPPPALFTLF